MDKDILEIQNVIQTKYDLPTQQTGIAPSDKFYHYDNFEQSLEQKLNSINSNLSLFPLNLGNNSCNSLLLSTVDKKPISCRFVKNSNMTNTVKRPETNSVFKAFNTIINQNSLNNSANSELYGQSLSKTNSIGGLGLNNNQNVLMNNARTIKLHTQVLKKVTKSNQKFQKLQIQIWIRLFKKIKIWKPLKIKIYLCLQLNLKKK